MGFMRIVPYPKCVAKWVFFVNSDLAFIDSTWRKKGVNVPEIVDGYREYSLFCIFFYFFVTICEEFRIRSPRNSSS